MNQSLGYLVRCGDPDAIDSIAPMAYGNLALDLLLTNVHGRLVVLRNGRYGRCVRGWGRAMRFHSFIILNKGYPG